MDLTIVTLISTMLIVSSIITSILSSKIKIHSNRTKVIEGNKQATNSDYETISTGYAYTIDMGESMVIVVVMDKKNSFNSFLGSQPIPIKVLGVEESN
ncbi:MAG: hypothetical protein QXZ41_06260 [Ignisphaera sp.]|uniref:Uncharacterized protein n=1 Tax=Ignisphaera aggregans TaxID=334771 RepID=A0A832FQ49_9CREN